MGTTIVNNTSEFLDAANLATTSGATVGNPDVIALNPANNNGGFYGPMCMPRSRTKLKIVSNSDSTPAKIAGLGFGDEEVGKGNFKDIIPSPNGATWSDITIDGVDLRGPRYTSFRNPSGVTHPMPGNDGSGYYWRVQPPVGAPATAWKEQSRCVALTMGPGVNGLLMQNCEVNGYEYAIKGDGLRNVTLQFNDFKENNEDCIYPNTSTGLTIRYNHMYAFRGLSDAETLLHFGVAKALHSDFIQIQDQQTDLLIEHNHLEDRTGRVHFGLLRPAESHPNTMNLRITVLGCFLDQAHDTGLDINKCNALIVRGNVVRRSGPNPYDSGKNTPHIWLFQEGSVDGDWGATKPIVQYNTAFDFFGTNNGNAPGSWTWDHNVEAQYGDVGVALPAQYYTEIRKTLLTDASDRAGRYGAASNVGPTKPPGLTNTQVFYYGLGEDPLLAGTGDERRAAQFSFPATSPAFNKQPRWQLVADGDDGLGRAMLYVGLAADGSKIWQMSSAIDPTVDITAPHLRYPGATPPANQFVDVRILYEDVGGGNRSAPSNFNFDVTVTQAGPTHTPTRTVDLSVVSGVGRVLGFYQSDVNGNVIPSLIVEAHLSDGLVWAKPIPTLIGAADSPDLSAIVQPNSPAAYGNGAYLMALAYGTAALTKPAAAFWGTQKLNTGVAQGQAACVVGGFATQANMTLGTFTGANGKAMAVSFNEVDPTNPLVDIKASNNASGLTCAVPALVLPTDEDNYAVYIAVFTTLSVGATKPSADWTAVSQAAIGGAPHGSLFRRNTAINAFSGATINLGGGVSASPSIGIAFALRLVGSSPP